MIILGVNTTQINSKIYLQKDGVIDFEDLGNSKVSESLLNKVEELLIRNNIDIDDVDFFSCGIGPGSFTGVRVGVATIKAFLIANTKSKCVPVGTFEPYIFANQISDGYILSQCTKNSVYCCEVKNGEILLISNLQNIQLKGLHKVYIIDNDLSALNSNFIRLDLPEKDYFRYVNKLIDESVFVDANQLVPNYCLESQAERNLKQNENNK